MQLSLLKNWLIKWGELEPYQTDTRTILNDNHFTIKIREKINPKVPLSWMMIQIVIPFTPLVISLLQSLIAKEKEMCCQNLRHEKGAPYLTHFPRPAKRHFDELLLYIEELIMAYDRGEFFPWNYMTWPFLVSDIRKKGECSSLFCRQDRRVYCNCNF